MIQNHILLIYYGFISHLVVQAFLNNIYNVSLIKKTSKIFKRLQYLAIIEIIFER